MRLRLHLFVLLACGSAGLAALSGCSSKPGGDKGFGNGGNGNLAVTVSDPATCGGTTGTFSHVYLTISDVQVSTSATAPAGDPSFVDLTPSLKSAPVQVDLLGTPKRCFLATLASGLTLTEASYAQVRVILAPDASGQNIAGNHCGLSSNCVILNGDLLNTPHPIQLGAETTQGIAIGPSQIAGGSFNATTGQPQTLNLNFDACASVVALGGNQFRLRPVIFAGDAGGNAASITGQLVDSASLQPVPSGQFTVALEQKDSRLIDRVMMETLADSKGNFAFCPVPAGAFDIVASGLRTDTKAAYTPTAALAVNSATALGRVPMTAVPSTPNGSASLSGGVQLQGVSNPPASADMTISALQLVTSSGFGAVTLTIPFLQTQASTITLPTQAGCAPNTNCAAFNVAVPPANVFFGQFSSSGTSFSQNLGLVTYTVEGTASVPESGAVADCSPSFAAVPVTNVNPDTNVDLTNRPLIFTSCQ
jgi:Domain of unknown function (DUF4382)